MSKEIVRVSLSVAARHLGMTPNELRKGAAGTDVLTRLAGGHFLMRQVIAFKRAQAKQGRAGGTLQDHFRAMMQDPDSRHMDRNTPLENGAAR